MDLRRLLRTDRVALLNLHSVLHGPAQTYASGDSREEIVEALKSRYGLTAKRAKDSLGKLRRDPDRYIFYLSVDIGR